MFIFAENTNYMMAAHFGGREGKSPSATYRDMKSMMI